MTISVGAVVKHNTYADWGYGVVTSKSMYKDFPNIVWEDDLADHNTDESAILCDPKEIRLHQPAPDEVFAQESEEKLEQLYKVGQTVVNNDGNLFGAIVSVSHRTSKGIYYKVVWEDSRETVNLQSTLHPVPADEKDLADILLTEQLITKESLAMPVDEPTDTATMNLLETLGWAESALKAEILKLVTSMDHNGHKVADAKELVEASKALLSMLERKVS